MVLYRTITLFLRERFQMEKFCGRRLLFSILRFDKKLVTEVLSISFSKLLLALVRDTHLRIVQGVLNFVSHQRYIL